MAPKQTRHEELPATQWVLDKLIRDPWEQLPMAASVPYFIVAAPVIGTGALGGYAADKVHDFVIRPAVGTGRLAVAMGQAVADLITAPTPKRLEIDVDDHEPELRRHAPHEAPLHRIEVSEPHALPGAAAPGEGGFCLPEPDPTDGPYTLPPSANRMCSSDDAEDDQIVPPVPD